MPTIYVPAATSSNYDGERARLMREYHRLHDERARLYAEIEDIDTAIIELKRRLKKLEGNEHV